MSLTPIGLDFRVEHGSSQTGNVEPLLHEIRHALAKLLDSGQETSIDLQGMPMAPGEEQRLLDTLGEGEVSASLDTLGHSMIRETRFPGVWLCVHKNHAGEVMGKIIEITRMPYILTAQDEDMRDGLLRLQQTLGKDSQTD